MQHFNVAYATPHAMILIQLTRYTTICDNQPNDGCGLRRKHQSYGGNDRSNHNH